ncbi:sodium transporter HKT1-like isoform X2 [Mangifera indica]|uniref:sodium transporter HKT1-like isoform X2 n=1 Tax=Mangifera indica TaxID=29780 RepID=UPI001CF98D2A|nr:sodium transporter HKT1-like isoform X2 [Mangifera indica]
MNNKHSFPGFILFMQSRIVSRVNFFWIHLFYYLTISSVGYLALRVTKPRTAPSFQPENLDLFFTSVSAMTNSSMSTVEMEVFSNLQLVFMTILMFIGAEVFVSWLELHLKSKLPRKRPIENDITELGLATLSSPQNENSTKNNFKRSLDNSIKILGYVILGYLVVVLVGGTSVFLLYVSLVESATEILKRKGLHPVTFSVFTIVSTFSNCGFVPTNENMIVFRKNSGLLWVLMPQVLLGNTLFPSCLWLVIRVLSKITRRVEFENMLRNHKEMGYFYLLSGVHSCYLGATVFGLLFVQFVLFCSLEWNSAAMDGLSIYQKVVGSLFEVVNSRYTGEYVFDLSILSSAVLVLFIVMIAYGNVGFSTGYSCKRQLKRESFCKDTSYGFVGRWSAGGKLMLIIVMFFGRLKRFNMNGGKSWKLS